MLPRGAGPPNPTPPCHGAPGTNDVGLFRACTLKRGVSRPTPTVTPFNPSIVGMLGNRNPATPLPYIAPNPKRMSPLTYKATFNCESTTKKTPASPPTVSDIAPKEKPKPATAAMGDDAWPAPPAKNTLALVSFSAH